MAFGSNLPLCHSLPPAVIEAGKIVFMIRFEAVQANELYLYRSVVTIVVNPPQTAATTAIATEPVSQAPAFGTECASVHIKCTHDLFRFLSSKPFRFQECATTLPIQQRNIK